jgi:hypothetical protein
MLLALRSCFFMSWPRAGVVSVSQIDLAGWLTSTCLQ